jgi:transcriptional regulator GlxA family with amidase domain
MANYRNNPASRRSRPHRVAVLVRHGVMPMELGLVHQLFRAAVSNEGRPFYEVITCAIRPGQVRTDADFTVRVEQGPDVLRVADTVIVPASHESDEAPSLAPAVVDALASIPSHARLASVCTGAFVLAAAGLLDHQRATTHWKSADKFRRMFPTVELHPDVLYTDGGRVLTSAGEAAGIDLCLHMIRQDHGATVANAVARTTVVPPHREGGQAQFIELPVPTVTDSSTAAARTWALHHLEHPLTLEQMAQQASLSVRSFTRKFRAELGTSPLQWLTQQRLQHARQLLEETDLPIDRIAARCGFGSGAAMRQHFHAALGLSPKRYRSTFRAAAPSR